MPWRSPWSVPEGCRLGVQVCVALALLAPAGCELRRAMYDQEKYEPLEASTFFADSLSARAPVPGTVARGQVNLDGHLYDGLVGGQPATDLPFPLTRPVLERGRQRYDIYCSPCHGRTGEGNGVIVQRGLRPPPTIHSQRLREAPVSHFYSVITKGFGLMYSYASRVPVTDRWAVAAYIRALQLSRELPYDQLSAEDQGRLP
ncbi:MAG: cytochrome c [Candidatus Latescibacterota bacterium]